MMNKLEKLLQAEIASCEKQIEDASKRLDVLRAAHTALKGGPTEKPRRGHPKRTYVTAKKRQAVLEYLQDNPDAHSIKRIANVMYGSTTPDAVEKAWAVMRRLQKQHYVKRAENYKKGYAWTVLRHPSGTIPKKKASKKTKKSSAQQKLSEQQRKGLWSLLNLDVKDYASALARKLWGVDTANKRRQARTLVYKWQKRGWLIDTGSDPLWHVKDGLLN